MFDPAEAPSPKGWSKRQANARARNARRDAQIGLSQIRARHFAAQEAGFDTIEAHEAHKAALAAEAVDETEPADEGDAAQASEPTEPAGATGEPAVPDTAPAAPKAPAAAPRGRRKAA